MTLTDISSAIYPYRQLLVAFSGGLDSTVLLHWLMLWRENTPDVNLRAIHINHGLSSHASEWVAHCQSLCEEWNIPLLIEHVTLADDGLGVEGQARKARYAVFNKRLLPGEALVIAQHLDDQSETFILALKRGSGPAGLSAMPARAAFASTHLLRPLLGETRASLLRWAQKYDLHWIEDESNQDDSYDRNFLRLRVLPLIAQRWPHFSRAVARSAELCAEQESLLDELLADELSAVMAANGTLAIAPLVSLSAQRRTALLRRWLAFHGAPMPSRTMMNCIWNEVAQAREDALPCLYLNGHMVRRFRGQLWLVIKKSTSLRETIVSWPDVRNALNLPQDGGQVYLTEPGNIRLPLPNETVSIRFKAPGMLLHIVGRSGGGRKLKKIWQEYNVPPWLRDAVPLLFYGETMIAAAGLFITQEGWTERGVRLEWKS